MRSGQGGAEGEAAKRAALIISGGLPSSPLAQQVLSSQAQQTFAPQGPEPTDDLREYNFYVQQSRQAGQEPVDFTTWSRENRRAGATTIDVTERMPPPPQGMAYQPDPTSPFGYKLVPIPGARDQRTEGERKADLLATRMEELAGDVLNEAPSITAQTAASWAQGGGITGALANRALSAEEQKHFNAARGWLAGVLRGDTGATIQPFEIQEYYPTFFPVPGDSAQVIEQKRQLRQVTQNAMRGNSGVPVGDVGNDLDLSGMTDEQLRELAR
jgi:hypothetical protein